MKRSKKRTTILSARFTNKTVIEFEEYVDSDPNFESLSDVVRTFCMSGQRYYKLSKLAENPLFVNKLEKQFHIQISTPTAEDTVRKMDLDEIEAFMLKIEKIKDEKINRIIAQGS